MQDLKILSELANFFWVTPFTFLKALYTYIIIKHFLKHSNLLAVFLTSFLIGLRSKIIVQMLAVLLSNLFWKLKQIL